MIELAAYAHTKFYVIRNSKVSHKFKLLRLQKIDRSKKLFAGRFSLPVRRIGRTEVSLLRALAAATTWSCMPAVQSTRKQPHTKRNATGHGAQKMK